MRRGCAAIFAALLCACASEGAAEPEPIGPRFWLAAGGFDSTTVEMFRGGDRIELRHSDGYRAIGTLSAEGLAAWDEAVATIDPAIVSDLVQCAPVDGIDICVNVEHESGPLQVCYCAIDPPPLEVAAFDAFYIGLGEALAQCESSPHLEIEQCEE
jgi:hypothetical protein